MENKKYWLVIDSWNLMESFVTESISPFSFYEKREFGNNLSRFISNGGETYNHLILTEFLPKTDYAIQISDLLLDKSILIKQTKNKHTYFEYPKTIYYKKGFVSFWFKDNDTKIAFISESKILFEVKCVDKYINDFYSDNTSSIPFIMIHNNSLSFESDNYLKFDNQYNFIKGALVAYSRGQLTSLDSEQQNFYININELKNTFAGLNTQLMIEDTPIMDMSVFQKIAICKNEYLKQHSEKTNIFDITSQVFREIINLSSLRSNELSKQKSIGYLEHLEELKELREECRLKLATIEHNYSISSVKKELDSIKRQEVKNGIAKGKEREYFKKGTTEQLRKDELKEIIKKFEIENIEYSDLKKKIVSIEQQIAHYRYGSTEYDTTISALFLRLSDNINDVIKKVNSLKKTKPIDFEKVEIRKNNISIRSNLDCKIEEIAYYNIVLNYILFNLSNRSRHISDEDILGIIKETGLVFSKTVYANTLEGGKILNTIKEYWSYKRNKSSNFAIPNDLKVLQAIMSFYIKAQGFDQIERFMLNKKYQHKELAFMLWGAYVGFADIPKTFTHVIYADDSISNELDSIIDQMIGWACLS